MKKNLLVLLSLLSVMAMGIGATACTDPETSSSSSAETSSESTSAPAVDSTSEEAEPSLSLSETTLSMNLYASATLTADLQNSTESIVWTSSDESVAKVVDGVVTACKTGTATITATAGTLVATCNIMVGEMGTFEFAMLETELRLMKGSAMPLDLTLNYNNVEFTMAEVSVETVGDKLTYQDGELSAVDYGTQNVVVTATMNGEVVYTHTIAVEVFESGSLTLDLEGEDIALKMSDEGFALSNFKAIVNGVEVENPDLVVTFSEEGVAKNENGKICPVAEGNITVTVQFSTSQGTYDKIVAVRVYKEVFTVGDFIAKGDAGKDASNIGQAVLNFAGQDIPLQDIEKVTIDGEETEICTVEGETLTFTDPEGGAHAIVLETAMERYNLNATFYGHSISTFEELEDWRISNIRAYTVLLNDIDAKGKTLSTLEGDYTAGVLDGLGHTICNFMMQDSFVLGVGITGAIKNLQLANFVQDCSKAGTEAVQFGVLAVDNMGTIENVMLKGKLINVPNADHYGLLFKGALNNSVCKNVFADLTTDCMENYHYSGPLATDGNYTLSNMVFVFNGMAYSRDYSDTQVITYGSMDAFSQSLKLSDWEGWTLQGGKFYMSTYDDSAYTVFSVGEAIIGKDVIIYNSGFEALTYEVTAGNDYVAFNENVMTILADKAMANETVVVEVKNEAGDVVTTFAYTIKLDATLEVTGRPLVGETIEFAITSSAAAERFTIEILEGADIATLDGNLLMVSEDAVEGSTIKVKVSCDADASWGEEFEFAVLKSEITEEKRFLVKGDAGKDVANIGNATLDLSETDVDLAKLEKVTIDGIEMTAYTVSGNAITFIEPAAGMHTIMFETTAVRYLVNVCFYGHSISSVAELEDWRKTQVLAYTVLLKDINAQGRTLAVSDVWREGVLDGLGHTIYNFTLTSGFVCAINGGGAIKNLQLVNFIQDCSLSTWENKFGVIGGENNGGLVENVLLKGSLINVPAGDHYGMIMVTALNNSVLRNVFAELTSDGTGNHYTGPWYKDGNWTISNVAVVFNANSYNPGYTDAQIRFYGNTSDFTTTVNLSNWEGWTLKDGKFYMSEYVTDGNYPMGDTEIVDTGKSFFVKTNGGSSSAIGAATVSLTELGLDMTDVESVLIDGKPFINFSFSENTLTLNNAPGGQHVYTLMGSDKGYTVSGCLYTHSISTLAELEAWRTNDIAGYTVLLADIDAQGAELATTDVWHGGILDGLGHTISNFKMTSSFVGCFNGTGAVKNLQLVNFTQDCTAYAWENKIGVICRENNGGLIENVLLKGDLINVPAGDHYGLISSTAGNNSVMRNVFAELTSTGSGNHYTGPWWTGSGYTISNVAIVFNASAYGANYTEDQICCYGNMDEFVANVDLSKWDGWTLQDGKFYMNEYEAALEV